MPWCEATLRVAKLAITSGREPTVKIERVRLWETRSSYADAYPKNEVTRLLEDLGSGKRLVTTEVG